MSPELMNCYMAKSYRILQKIYNTKKLYKVNNSRVIFGFKFPLFGKFHIDLLPK